MVLHFTIFTVILLMWFLVPSLTPHLPLEDKAKLPQVLQECEQGLAHSLNRIILTHEAKQDQ